VIKDEELFNRRSAIGHVSGGLTRRQSITTRARRLAKQTRCLPVGTADHRIQTVQGFEGGCTRETWNVNNDTHEK
jgi:hypothetical protein